MPATASGAPATEASVDVAVDVVPARANITLDGRSVGRSPFHATVRKDSTPHMLGVSAEGYAAETRTIAFDRDVRVDISMRPVSGTARTAVVAIPTGTAPSATAGSDLQVARPKRNIDEKDPY